MQGSTLSTMLCSIFLGHLERTHLLPLLACKQLVMCTNGSSATSGPGLTELAEAAGARVSCTLTLCKAPDELTPV